MRHAALVDLKERIHIRITEAGSEQLAAEERRVPDDYVGIRPFGLLGIGGLAEVENRIPGLDVFQRLKDRLCPVCKPVVEHPLDFADPDADTRQFRGVIVDFDPVDDMRPDTGKRARSLERARPPFDYLALEVFEATEGDIEEVPGA